VQLSYSNCLDCETGPASAGHWRQDTPEDPPGSEELQVTESLRTLIRPADTDLLESESEDRHQR
jgi:hypothetical protein